MSEAGSSHTHDMEIMNDDAISNVLIVEIKSLGLDWDHELSEQGVNTCEIPTLETEESSHSEENELNCSFNSRKNVSFCENSSILHYSENDATLTLSNLVPETIISAKHSPQEPKLLVPKLPDNENAQTSLEPTKSENCSVLFTSSNHSDRIDAKVNPVVQKRDSKGRFIKRSESKNSTRKNTKSMNLKNTKHFKKKNSEQNKIDSVNSVEFFPINNSINKGNYFNVSFDKYPCVHLEKLNLVQEDKNTSDTSQSKRNMETNFKCEEPKLSVLKVNKTSISQAPIDVAHLSRSDENGLSSITNTHDTSLQISEKSSIEKFCQSELDEKIKEKNDQNPNLEIYPPLKEAVVLLERLNLPVCHVNENPGSAFKCNTEAGNIDSFSAVDDKMRKSESHIHSREIISIPESDVPKKSNSFKRSSKAKSPSKKKKKRTAVNCQKTALEKKMHAPIFRKRAKKNINSFRKKTLSHASLIKNDFLSSCLTNYFAPPAALESSNLIKYTASDMVDDDDDSSIEDNLLSYLEKQNYSKPVLSNSVKGLSKLNSNDDIEKDLSDDDVPLFDLGKDHVNPSNFTHEKNKNLPSYHNSNSLKSMHSNYENDILLSHVEEVSIGPSSSDANLNKSMSPDTEICLSKQLEVGIPSESILKKIMLDHSYPSAKNHSNSDVSHATSRKNRKTLGSLSKHSTFATTAKLSEKKKIVTEKSHQSKQTVKHGKKVPNKVVESHGKNTASEEEGISKKALRKKQAEVYETLLKYLRKQIKSLSYKNKRYKKTKQIKKNVVKKHKNNNLQSLITDSETESSSSVIVDSSSEEASLKKDNYFHEEITVPSQSSAASSSGHSRTTAKSSKKRDKSLDKYRLGFLSKKRALRLHNKCLASERFLFSNCKLKKKEKKKMKKMLKMFDKFFYCGTE